MISRNIDWPWYAKMTAVGGGGGGGGRQNSAGERGWPVRRQSTRSAQCPAGVRERGATWWGSGHVQLRRGHAQRTRAGVRVLLQEGSVGRRPQRVVAAAPPHAAPCTAAAAVAVGGETDEDEAEGGHHRRDRGGGEEGDEVQRAELHTKRRGAVGYGARARAVVRTGRAGAAGARAAVKTGRAGRGCGACSGRSRHPSTTRVHCQKQRLVCGSASRSELVITIR